MEGAEIERFICPGLLQSLQELKQPTVGLSKHDTTWGTCELGIDMWGAAALIAYADNSVPQCPSIGNLVQDPDPD